MKAQHYASVLCCFVASCSQQQSPSGSVEHTVADAPMNSAFSSDHTDNVANRFSPSSAERESKQVPSEFREGLTVEALYKQDLGEPYFTTWLGRLEKSQGDWRDVYVETNEKLTDKGIISFRCNENAGDPVGWVSYGVERFGDEASKNLVKIQSDDWENWRSDNLTDGEGNPASVPPYELYVAARSKFC